MQSLQFRFSVSVHAQHFMCAEAGTSEPKAKRAKKEEDAPDEAGEAEVEDEGKKKEPGTKGLVEGNFDDDDDDDEDFEGNFCPCTSA